LATSREGSLIVEYRSEPIEPARPVVGRRLLGGPEVKARLLAVVIVALVFAACGGSSAAQPPFIDLGERVRLPTGGIDEVAPLRIAVAAILSPEGNIESYGALSDYIGTKLNRPVEIVQRRTYQEINDLLEAGDVDVGFVCTSAYVLGHDEFGLRLLAAPQIAGETVYYSKLIVAADNSAENMADLRGAIFAFSDPISTSGLAYPTLLVEQLGETPETFFDRTFFTYSHEGAIDAVVGEVADAANVDSLVLDFVLARNPDLPIKVIDRSPAFKIPPAVASPSLSPRQAAEIQDLLLAIADDPEAASVLAELGIDRFVAVDDAEYDGVRGLIYRDRSTP
jgi:phosphonate transport system substrate-binding protein